MTTEDLVRAESANFELVITRVIDAPRGLVWRAFTEPERLARWMGPRGFTCTIIKHDLRVGGAYRYHLLSPEGTDHWQQGTYREIVEPERLVFSFVWTDVQGIPRGADTLVSTTFEDQDGKTRLTLRQSGFKTETARDAHHSGWSSSLELLAEYAAQQKPKGE